MKKILIVIFLFLILGLAYMYREYKETEVDTNIDSTNTQSAILFINHQIPGFFIVVEKALLNKVSYIVIYENNNGNKGNILGNSTALPKGEQKNVVIGLTRATINGETLIAVLHEDTGDGIFFPALDTPIKDRGGNNMQVIFRVQEL